MNSARERKSIKNIFCTKALIFLTIFTYSQKKLCVCVRTLESTFFRQRCYAFDNKNCRKANKKVFLIFRQCLFLCAGFYSRAGDFCVRISWKNIWYFVKHITLPQIAHSTDEFSVFIKTMFSSFTSMEVAFALFFLLLKRKTISGAKMNCYSKIKSSFPLFFLNTLLFTKADWIGLMLILS